MSLLERLSAKQDRTHGAPSFDWVLNSGYIFRAEGPAPGSDAVATAITSDHPIAGLCVEPGTVARGLRWIDAAIRDEVLLDRKAVWKALQMKGDFDECRFVLAFDKDLRRWLAVCEHASYIGGKVTLRMDHTT
jgi:hypothetical protein